MGGSDRVGDDPRQALEPSGRVLPAGLALNVSSGDQQ